jgi:hypothetical protein
VLYRFNTSGSIGGGVITHALDGQQYVAATSGTVSAFFGGSGLPADLDTALKAKLLGSDSQLPNRFHWALDG